MCQATHHHFFYHVNTKKISGHVKYPFGNSDKNFPIDCFYNESNNEIYSFYSQGESFRVPVLEVEWDINCGKEAFYFEKITEKDLG